MHTSGVDQIPDEEGIRVEIAEVEQGVEPKHPGNARSDVVARPHYLWGQLQEEEIQWGDPETTVTWTITNEVEIRAEEPQELFATTTTPPPPAETEESSALLVSSDERMTLTVRNFLGAGAHGTVVSADWAEGCRQVAVKVSHKLFISELDYTEPGLKNLKNELDVLKALKLSREYGELGSNFFPELFKSWQDAKNVYFAMDVYPWNLEDLRWANSDWDASIGDKLLWTAEMVCFHFAFASLSCSPISADSRRSGPASNANFTPRHKAGQRFHHVHQTCHHRRLRSRSGLARSVLRQLPNFLIEGSRRSRDDVLSRSRGSQGVL